MTKKDLTQGLALITFLLLIIGLVYKFNDDGIRYSLLSENSVNTNSSCIQCHGNLKGISPYHQEIGCISCHKGNNESSLKDSSHIGLISIPGNMSDADNTCGICHPQALSDLKNSLMTSNSGIISIDRFIFGETHSPNMLAHIDSLGYGPADTHLRNLCSHCHIGNEKTAFAPTSQLSRGGGCNACHLNYSADARSELNLILNDSNSRIFHPSLDLNITNDHCFGCHSRSGRISTNYEGWHETLLSKDSVQDPKKYKVLEDDRVFRYVQEDIHNSKGIECIDCHNYEDIMGDGQLYAHEEEAVKISCEDCHFENNATILDSNDLNFTHKRILSIRKYENVKQTFLGTKKDSTPLLNTYFDDNNLAYLIRKSDRKKMPLKSPGESCNREAGHKDISCSACHSSWAPQCIGCHTDYDPVAQGYDLFKGEYMKGSWVEYAAEFLADAPTLGVRKNKEKREIQAAIPGMIMTLDQSQFKGSEREKIAFHRLFAPASPHTTDTKGRSCTSCHSNPLALGYGRGNLEFSYKNKPPKWTFEAEYENLKDGLPADAWIGFLEDPTRKQYSTRIDFFPFSLEQQKRVLIVGACFSCHKEDSETMKESLKIPFEDYKKKMSVKCILPVFN